MNRDREEWASQNTEEDLEVGLLVEDKWKVCLDPVPP